MSDARPALDALMHEWHEWSSRGGRQPEPRYDGCYGMADFVLKHLDEWATEVPWCAEHNAEYSERLGKCWMESYWSAVICRVEEPAHHYVIGEAE